MLHCVVVQSFRLIMLCLQQKECSFQPSLPPRRGDGVGSGTSDGETSPNISRRNSKSSVSMSGYGLPHYAIATSSSVRCVFV
jgi:hypothetical protein